MSRNIRGAGVLFAGLLVPALACATEGYFSHGYGLRSQGMGARGRRWRTSRSPAP